MTAKKARLYKVTLRDGNGCRHKYIPAPSQDQLKNNLNNPSTIKIIDIKSLGFQEFNALPSDEDDGVAFTAEYQNEKIIINPGDRGHSYLKLQFPQQAKNVEDFLDEKNS